MAGTLLHVTLAGEALAGARIAEADARAVAANRHDFDLGAVLPDLPYYDRLLSSGLKSLAGLDVEYSPWGTLLHLRSPSRLGRALLDRADDGPGRALALGFLTHLAADLVFHRAIHALVLEAADGSASLDTEHKRIEDRIDRHAYLRLLGAPGIGTAYARRALALRPDPRWAGRAAEAIAQIHGNAPDPRRLRRWLAKLAWFGRLSSFGQAPWVPAPGPADPRLAEQAAGLCDEAVRLSARYLETGSASLAGKISAQEFETAIPDRSLLDGKEAALARPCSAPEGN